MPLKPFFILILGSWKTRQPTTKSYMSRSLKPIKSRCWPSPKKKKQSRTSSLNSRSSGSTFSAERAKSFTGAQAGANQLGLFELGTTREQQEELSSRVETPKEPVKP